MILRTLSVCCGGLRLYNSDSQCTNASTTILQLLSLIVQVFLPTVLFWAIQGTSFFYLPLLVFFILYGLFGALTNTLSYCLNSR